MYRRGPVGGADDTSSYEQEAADLLDEYAVPAVVVSQLPSPRPKIRFYLIHGHSPAAASILSVAKCSTSKVSSFCLPQVEG